MKKSTIITLVAFLFFGVTVIAQEQTHEKKSDLLKRTNYHFNKDTKNESQLTHSQFSKGQVSRPGNSEDYFWESGSSTWFHSTNTEYTYNETGQLLEQLATEANTGANN